MDEEIEEELRNLTMPTQLSDSQVHIRFKDLLSFKIW